MRSSTPAPHLNAAQVPSPTFGRPSPLTLLAATAVPFRPEPSSFADLDDETLWNRALAAGFVEFERVKRRVVDRPVFAAYTRRPSE